jgi:hypothetical protein
MSFIVICDSAKSIKAKADSRALWLLPGAGRHRPVRPVPLNPGGRPGIAMPYWYVEAEWADGTVDEIGQFKSISEAWNWIARQSRAWLDERGQLSRWCRPSRWAKRNSRAATNGNPIRQPSLTLGQGAGRQCVACRRRVDPSRHSVGPDQRNDNHGARAHRDKSGGMSKRRQLCRAGAVRRYACCRRRR